MLLLLGVGGAACSVGCVAPPAREASPGAQGSARQNDALVRRLLEQPDRAAYRGWLKYLLQRTDHGPALESDRSRLVEWAERIEANPRTLHELRGTHEWGYESPVDGSGQPFTIHVPTDYDPNSPAPLFVFLHGLGGDHRSPMVDWKPHPNYFEVAPLGRSRASGFVALGEADVLHVIDYVEREFNIDPDRVHLWGVSMGGFGTTWLGARHPDRFASLRPVCGSAIDVALENLLGLPVRALHDEEDWIAPIAAMRGPLARLLELGGDASLDATTGWGHGVFGDRERIRQGHEWSLGKRRAKSSQVRELDFTALDGSSVRSFWAAIEEWGPEPRPARFTLRVAPGNVLRVKLDNVRRLKLWLRNSPLDDRRAVTIIRASATERDARPLTIPPSTSASPIVIEMDATSGELRLSESAVDLPFRLHSPGGANQLYDGQPLLIVYGTQGNARERAKLEAAAHGASRSADWTWQTDAWKERDGVPINWNVYGSLPLRADVDVTADELASHHLVLIGTAEQNTVAASIADRLPVNISGDHVEFSDGLSVPAAGVTLRLVYHNPLAPQRLLHWVAATSVDAYASHWSVLDLLGVNPHPWDALISDDAQATLLLGRSFDSRWRWRPREDSPLIEGDPSLKAVAMRIAALARERSGADFAVADWPTSSPGSKPKVTLGLTRLSDVFPYYAPLSRTELSGEELLAAQMALAAASFEGGLLAVGFVPTPSATTVDRARRYSVVMGPGGIIPFFEATRLSSRHHQQTGLALSGGR